MLNKLSAIAISIMLTLIYPLATKAQILAEIGETSALKVGVRIDAFPFAYLNSEQNLTGYCLDLINLLRQEVKQRLNKDVVAVRLYRSTLANRFDLLENNLVHLECGPNTIRKQTPQPIGFSAPFFVTGTQFLIKTANQDLIDDSLENMRIGVLEGTSTEALLENNYPLAKLEKFQGAMGRSRGILALRRDKIDAFASDGILLLGEAAQQGLSLQNYRLVPRSPLTCDYYGMLIPANDDQWRNLVNSVLESEQTKQALSDWLQTVSSDLNPTEDSCN